MKSILALITMFTVILSIFSFAKEEGKKSTNSTNSSASSLVNIQDSFEDKSKKPNVPDINYNYKPFGHGHSSPIGVNLSSDMRQCIDGICNKDALSSSRLSDGNCSLGESNQMDPSCMRKGQLNEQLNLDGSPKDGTK